VNGWILVAAVAAACVIAVRMRQRGNNSRRPSAWDVRPTWWGALSAWWARHDVSSPPVGAGGIQPADVAAMVDQLLDGVLRLGWRDGDGALLLPREVVVFAHPRDVGLLHRCRGYLEHEIAGAITQSSIARGLAVPATLRIVDVRSDAGMTAGRPLVQRSTTSRQLPAARAAGDSTTNAQRIDAAPDHPRQGPDEGPARFALLGGDAFAQVLVPQEGGKLGRDPRTCSVVVAGATVSREHALLTPVPGGFQVSDLGSANGLSVNGERVGEAVLHHGDVLALGRAVWLRLDLGAPAPRRFPGRPDLAPLDPV